MSITAAVGAKRADAVRNIERALDAAVACLSARPNATMAEIAKQAGIGRVTLYGHFASRAELVAAVVARVVERGDEALAQVDLDGDPRAALERLMRSSWRLVDEARTVVAVAEAELPSERIRSLHDSPAARVQALIERGRDDGSFRDDTPVTWQIAVLHQVLHGAVAEVAAGRVAPSDAPDLITTTVFDLLDRR